MNKTVEELKREFENKKKVPLPIPKRENPNKQIEKLKQTNENYINDIKLQNERILGLTEQNTNLKTNLLTINVKLENVENLNLKYSKEVLSLNEELKTAQKTVSNYEKEIKDQETKFQNLTKQLEKIEIEKKNLEQIKNRYETQNIDVENDKKEKNNLIKQIEGLSNKEKELHQEIDKLKNEITTSNKNIDTYNNSVLNNLRTIDGLNNKIEVLKTDLNTKINQLEEKTGENTLLKKTQEELNNIILDHGRQKETYNLAIKNYSILNEELEALKESNNINLGQIEQYKREIKDKEELVKTYGDKINLQDKNNTKMKWIIVILFVILAMFVLALTVTIIGHLLGVLYCRIRYRATWWQAVFWQFYILDLRRKVLIKNNISNL